MLYYAAGGTATVSTAVQVPGVRLDVEHANAVVAGPPDAELLLGGADGSDHALGDEDLWPKVGAAEDGRRRLLRRRRPAWTGNYCPTTRAGW